MRRITAAGEVIKIIEFSPIDMGSDTLFFRLEILKRPNTRRLEGRLMHKEFFRIQPTFPQKRNSPSDKPCDELLWVEDMTVPGAVLKSTTGNWRKMVRDVINELERRFP